MKPTGVAGLRKDCSGRLWHEKTPGVHVAVFPEELQCGADLKRAFILRHHVGAFVRHWGRNHVLFFTTTDAEGVGPKVYARRWNSLLAHESKWIRGFLRVLEPQKNGRPHFHNLVAVPWDTQPDAFDWVAFEEAQKAFHAKDWVTFRTNRVRYVASAASELRALWAWSRRVMPRYGLGRSEILPVRKEGAIDEYLGKYLDKGIGVRVDDWKGVRRFESDRRTSKEWKRCGTKFSWVGWRLDKETGVAVPTGAFFWRQRLAQLAEAVGLGDCGDPSKFTPLLGRHWAHRLRGVIATGSEADWQAVLAVLRNEFQPPSPRWHIAYDNGENAAW
jgi:hypothetical protein